MNPIAIRLLNQQLIAPRYSKPTEVVRYMGAMQAQEYRMMRWAVAMRTRKPSHKAFKQAYDEGKIIRLHLMRGTWQLVCAEDYWSMIDLFAPKAIAVTKGWMSSNKISIPDDELIGVRDILIQTAADKRSVTKEDFVLALTERNQQMDDHRLSYHIRMAELTGVLCSGDLLPMKATYALAADKVKSSVKMERDEALAQLYEEVLPKSPTSHIGGFRLVVRIEHQLQVTRHRAPSRTPASCPQRQRHFPPRHRLQWNYLR